MGKLVSKRVIGAHIDKVRGFVSFEAIVDISSRTNQVSHLMSVASFPEGKKTMLRANMELVAGLIGLFGDPTDAVHDHAAESDPMDADGEHIFAFLLLKALTVHPGANGCYRGGECPAPSQR